MDEIFLGRGGAAPLRAAVPARRRCHAEASPGSTRPTGGRPRLGRVRHRLPEATFFHRAGWQGILRDVFGHDSHFLYAEEDGRIAACCRWRT